MIYFGKEFGRYLIRMVQCKCYRKNHDDQNKFFSNVKPTCETDKLFCIMIAYCTVKWWENEQINVFV